MSISPEEVRHVATLARLALSDEEMEMFREQLGEILAYVDRLQEVDVEGVEPYVTAAGTDNVFRQDSVAPSLPREDALGNAPREEDGGFSVPKVVSGGNEEA